MCVVLVFGYLGKYGAYDSWLPVSQLKCSVPAPAASFLCPREIEYQGTPPSLKFSASRTYSGINMAFPPSLPPSLPSFASASAAATKCPPTSALERPLIAVLPRCHAVTASEPSIGAAWHILLLPLLRLLLLPSWWMEEDPSALLPPLCLCVVGHTPATCFAHETRQGEKSRGTFTGIPTPDLIHRLRAVYLSRGPTLQRPSNHSALGGG